MSQDISLDDLLKPEAREDDPIYIYSYKKGIKDRTLCIDGEIDEDFARLIIMPLLEMEKEDPTAPIKLYINSPGGTIMDGLVLCDLIDHISCPLTIEILGYAYSMAGYIAMAGANNPNVTKVCHKFSFGLIHAGNVGYSGDARKAKQLQAFYDRVDELIKDYILTHTKITEEKYNENIDVEWYLTSKEMLELGIVDKILDE